MKLSKTEKRIIFCIGIAILVIAVCASLLIFNNNKDSVKQGEETEEAGSDALTDKMDYYPENITLNRTMQDITFYNTDGGVVQLSDFRGKNVIILFWASWCKYCKEEINNMDDYAKVLKNYNDVEFILVNKLDGEKETKEQALNYLKDHNTPFDTYFDEGVIAYNELGTKIIPTFYGIDTEGVLKICNPGNIGGADEFTSFIDYVRNGGSKQTEEFITTQLTSPLGGVHVNYKDSNETSPSGYDVLSESQGIMMEYAVLKKDQKLFDRYLDFITDNMLLSDSLTGWMLNEEGKADVNALLDDIRIYKALFKANELWGGYDNILDRWESSIYSYNVKKSKPVDYYDFKYKKKANRITLCYLDLEAFQLLREADSDYNDVYDNANYILEGGYINDEFPLYYSWYDYSKDKYMNDDLNMSEAMLTLLHLAEKGKLKEETVRWLEYAMDNGGIRARYNTKGKVVKGYNYESTATYATVAMIANEIENDRLMTLAIARMELTRVNDNASPFNGAFSQNDGNDIFSYDQCIPLLAYANLEK